MKKILFICFLFLLMACNPREQEQFDAQIVASWNVGDTKTYRFTVERSRFENGEVDRWQINRYAVTITIIDYIENYYLIDWSYHDFDFYANDVDWMNMMRKHLVDNTYIIRTDRMGVLKELVNWEEVRDRILQRNEWEKQLWKSKPENADIFEYINSLFAHTNKMYSKQEVIEAMWMDEVRQFFIFHGGQFNLGERNRTTVQRPNIFGFEFVDARRNVWLDKINEENETFFIRMQQESNIEQLLNATIRTFQHNLELEMRPLIKRGEATKEELEEYLEWLANMDVFYRHIIQISSTIHNSGWPIHSIQTQEVF